MRIRIFIGATIWAAALLAVVTGHTGAAEASGDARQRAMLVVAAE